MSGYETGAPYRVLDASHWAFAGTGLGPGDPFGTASADLRCPGGAWGHETVVRVLPLGEQMRFFSASSTSYCPALSVDNHVSAVTRNVLRRFVADDVVPTGAG